MRFLLLAASLLVATAHAANNSAFVSQNVPAVMVPGQVYAVSVTLQNTGTTTWSSGALYKLGTQNPMDNTLWTGSTRVALPSNVAPGQNVTFNFNVTAPSTPGTYNFQWKMVQEFVEWFGAQSVNVAVKVGLNDAIFASQSVPPVMTPGQSYAVTVTMTNTGGSTWSTSGYRLGSQNPENNMNWGLNRVAPTATTPPGSNGVFNFNVTAPSTPGTYNFQWKMGQSGVEWFGGLSNNVAVKVGLDNAAFVSQSVPATMIAGQNYAVSVTMQNNGSTTWPAGSAGLGSQNAQDNTTWGLNRVPLTTPVGPGASRTFNFSVTAPSAPGTYNFQWKMLQEPNGWFGAQSTSVAVNVAPAAADTNVFFIHVDHLNTPRLVTNQTGQAVWRWDQQEPFGNNPPDENPSGLGAFEFDLRFPGHVWSKETQTAYNGHRDAYDPAIGRYPQSDPIGLEGAWSKLYAYRPRYLDVRAGRYVPEHPDRMNDARYALIQGSMLFRRPLLAGATPMAQELNTYAYANLDPLKNFDISGLQAQSFDPPKGGGPSPWSWSISEYELCLAKSCAAGMIAGGVVGKWAGAGVGFLGGFFLGGYFCPGDPPNLSPGSPPPGNTPPSAPPKNN